MTATTPTRVEVFRAGSFQTECKLRISPRALVRRINRRLAKQQWPQRLKRCRHNSRAYQDVGDYYILDVYHHVLIDSHVDLEAKGRELDVLQSYENVIDEATTPLR